MRVVIIKRGNYPGKDKTECHQFAEHLLKLGHTVRVICLSEAKTKGKRSQNGVDIFEISNNFFSRKFFHIFAFFLFSEKADVIHIFWGKGTFAFPVLNAIFKRHTRNILCDVRSGAIFNGFHASCVNFLIKLETYFFPKISFLDENLKDRILGKSQRNRMYFIPEGFNSEYFNDKKKEINTIRQKFVNGNQKLLIYVGTLHRLRKLEHLIYAFHDVYKKNNLALLFLGEGTGENDIRAAVKKCNVDSYVYFHEYVLYERVPDFIKASDFAVSYIPITPSFDVQQPLKTIEYCACNIPVLATRTKGNQMVIIDNKNGILVDDSIESVTEGLNKMCNSKFNDIVKVNKSIVNKYSWSNIAVSLEKCYRDPIN